MPNGTQTGHSETSEMGNNNLARQLDRSEMNSEMSLVHLANLQYETFSISPGFAFQLASCQL